MAIINVNFFVIFSEFLEVSGIYTVCDMCASLILSSFRNGAKRVISCLISMLPCLNNLSTLEKLRRSIYCIITSVIALQS
jgi:hypothetical protein